MTLTGMWYFYVGLAFCSIAQIGDVQAQETTTAATNTPALPSMKPKVPAHWVITYEQKQEVAPPMATGPNASNQKSPRLVKEDYQLDGQTAAVSRLYSDGTLQRTYIIKGIAFTANQGDQHARAEMVTEGAGRELRFGNFYPGFDWLKPEFFVDAPEQGGRKLAHYRQAPTKGKGGPAFDPYATKADREAWIDVDNQLPFAFREAGRSGVYQFETASDQKIVIPPEIDKAIRYYNGYR